MNKLTDAFEVEGEVEIKTIIQEIPEDDETEKEGENEDKNVVDPVSSSNDTREPEEKKSKSEDEKKDILRFTMLFNKFTSELNGKKGSRNGEEVKKMMFFNKEVTVNSDVEPQSETANTDVKKTGGSTESRVISQKTIQKPLYKPVEFGKPQISEPAMMFSSSLSPPDPDVFCKKSLLISFWKSDPENLKKINKRNSKSQKESLVQSNVNPSSRTDLRIHTSLTSIPRNNKNGLRGVLKSKIPSLTSIDTSMITEKSCATQFSYWDHLDDLVLRQSDLDKGLTLQISKSSNDNNKRSPKFKKEDVVSVSDSKLLNSSNDTKKHIKKCDKKSRGDSFRKERDFGNRKQVQWKTEVDVIYFSTNLPANGDRYGEVVGRVIEPLREEWEQQRKGFYAKLIPLHMESHIKDRFKSLLKI